MQVGAGGGGGKWEALYGALEARHAKINPDKEHNQPFPSIKWIKAIEGSCQKNEVNIMSLPMKPQA